MKTVRFFWPTLYLPYRVSGLNTYGRRAFWVAGPMAWNSLPAGIQPAAQTVLGVYLKRTCSRVTSASSTWGSQRLRAIQFHARTHSFTHGVVERNRISSLQSHEKASEKEHCLPGVFRDTGDTPANFFYQLSLWQKGRRTACWPMCYYFLIVKPTSTKPHPGSPGQRVVKRVFVFNVFRYISAQ